MLPNGRGSEIVPRRMLDLCKDLLRSCLAERIALQRELDEALAEIARLKRRRRTK
jgi:hypothetical protein